MHSLTGQQVDNLLNNPSEEFEKDIQRQKVAKQALAEWQAQERIKRALNSRAWKVYEATWCTSGGNRSRVKLQGRMACF